MMTPTARSAALPAMPSTGWQTRILLRAMLRARCGTTAGSALPAAASSTRRASRRRAPRDQAKRRAAVAQPLLPTNERCTGEPTGDRLLNVNEAAALLGVAPGTLYNWAYERRLPKVKLYGPRGALRFRESDVRRLINTSLRPALLPLPRDSDSTHDG